MNNAILIVIHTEYYLYTYIRTYIHTCISKCTDYNMYVHTYIIWSAISNYKIRIKCYTNLMEPFGRSQCNKNAKWKQNYHSNHEIHWKEEITAKEGEGRKLIDVKSF